MADEHGDQVRPITSAPTAKERQRDAEHREREDDRAFEERAHRVAATLKERGAVRIMCADTAEAEKQARRIGRRAGKLINRRVRTKAVEGGIMVWDDERGTNPLHVQLDEARATRIMDRDHRENPLFPEGFPPPAPAPGNGPGPGTR